MMQPSGTDLQAWPLAMAAFRRVWEERDDLLRLAAGPVIVSFGINLWAQSVAEPIFDILRSGQQPDPADLDKVMGQMALPIFVGSIISWCLPLMFSANWMRHMILGAGAVPGLGITPARRHFRLILMSFALHLAWMLVMLLGLVVLFLASASMAVMFAASIISMIWFVIIVVRLTPVWVGIAIDAPMRLQDAWQRTQGNGIKMAVCFLMVFFSLSLLQLIFVSLSISMGIVDAAPLALSFVSIVIQFVMVAIISTILTLAYPRFVSETV